MRNGSVRNLKQPSIHRQLRQVLEDNKDGSFATQQARHDILMVAVGDLHSLGYSNLKLTNLKYKHVKALVKDWKIQGISNATMKNRLSHLRWLAAKLGKPNVIPRTNKELGIENRCYVDNEKNKAWELTREHLSRISSERVRLSLELERYFGMRKEESLKFRPEFADKGKYLLMKGSWCKGGRPREIPITTEKQRRILRDCHRVAGHGSMIPEHKTYAQYLTSFEKYCARAGIGNVHGLRHKYAQEEYKTIAGWECPKNGGIRSKKMTAKQKQVDYEARMKISHALGHGREKITAVYLGR